MQISFNPANEGFREVEILHSESYGPPLYSVKSFPKVYLNENYKILGLRVMDVVC